ncbi:MAG: 50S ribosomal protein L17 [Candidatus Omnitrophica bacterium]|nr:50S ribosomal protein L17 [Candidatus Omnitrophota bacterium]MDD5356021.1 50S ribosomal protein L17 [Candidatus Omnitrophota bacterium]
MRHKVKTDRFSRFSSYRKATIKSMVIAVLLHQHIITKKVRAKSVRRSVDKIITLGKKGTLAAKRRAFSLLCDHKLVKLLFDTIAPKFANRSGGYTRIIPYRRQRGDNAELAILELTERYEVKKIEKAVKAEKPQQQDAVKKQEKEAPIKEDTSIKEAKPQPVEKEAKKVRKEKIVKKEPEEAKEAKEKKEPEKKEEKPQLPPKKEEQKEEKKPGKFFKGFKGFFKKDK